MFLKRSPDPQKPQATKYWLVGTLRDHWRVLFMISIEMHECDVYEPGAGVTKSISSIPLVFTIFAELSNHRLPTDYHVGIWGTSQQRFFGNQSNMTYKPYNMFFVRWNISPNGMINEIGLSCNLTCILLPLRLLLRYILYKKRQLLGSSESKSMHVLWS